MTYRHDHKDPNLSGSQKALKYDADGEPTLRVSIENIEANSGVITVDGTVDATIVGGAFAVANKPYYLEVAQGLIPGYSSNHKFGAAPSMSNNTNGSVWDVDDTLYPFDAFGTGSVINVERNNVADEGTIIRVQGLDVNYDYIEEDITITGANTLGTAVYIRLNRAFMVTDGGTNVGNIDIELGAAGGVTVARITASYAQTLMAVYTIPAGKTGYLLATGATAAEDADATIALHKRESDSDVFTIVTTFELQKRGGGFSQEFFVPLVLGEKTDIDLRVISRDNNKRFTGTFDILLVDNA